MRGYFYHIVVELFEDFQHEVGSRVDALLDAVSDRFSVLTKHGCDFCEVP